MQLVVVNAVAAAVMAATITFNSTSQKRLLFISIFNFQLSIIRSATSGDASLAKNCRRPLPFIQGRIVVVATAAVVTAVVRAAVVRATTVLGAAALIRAIRGIRVRSLTILL